MQVILKCEIEMKLYWNVDNMYYCYVESLYWPLCGRLIPKTSDKTFISDA